MKKSFAVLAQQAEHFLGKEEVGSSNLLDSSTSEWTLIHSDFLLHKNYDLCSKKCAARIELLRIVIFEKKAKKIVFLLEKYANIKNGRKVQNKK